MKNRKSKKANLENKRGMFFQIGMVLSLAVVLAAFEWTTLSPYTITDWDYGANIPIEEIATITNQEMPKPLPKINLAQQIEIVLNTEDLLDDDLIIDVEIHDDTRNVLDFDPGTIEEIEKEDDVIHVFVENYPEFPGGEVAMMKYLGSNLQYSEAAREIGLEGTVYVSFVVWKDGSIQDVKILRGLGAGLDEEVVRVILSMPKWKPGNQNGKNVNVEFKMPIKFNLK